MHGVSDCARLLHPQALSAGRMLPSRQRTRSAPRNSTRFAARYPARGLPCERFTAALASRNLVHHSGPGRLARPYPVEDLHLLSFASFPGALRFGSKSAVPSMIEHSRSTFNCGRIVTCASRPEVAEPQNRKLEAVNRRPTDTPSKAALCRGCCSEIPQRRRNMRPNAQLFRKRRAHDH